MKLIICLAVMLLTGCSHRSTTPPLAKEGSVVCTDFLAKWNMGYPQVTFVDCEKEDESKAQPKLFAKYTVKGTDAKSVEKYLVEKFQMRPLEFICCGWSPEARNDTIFYADQGRGTYLDVEYKNYFTIALMSGETIEKDWQKIDFTLVVETYYKEI